MKTNNKVMILGGYGTFGSRIATLLNKENMAIIIAGRNNNKSQKLKQRLQKQNSKAQIEIAVFDVHKQLTEAIKQYKPKLIIHTCGPFQGQEIDIAQTCIQQGVHYIDLADGRSFIQSLSQLDSLAKKNDVMVITAASTVPTLSAAVIEHHLSLFSEFNSIDYGITPGQKTDRGLATTQGILSYIGKAIKPWKGVTKTSYGWQDIYLQKYPQLGNRLMGNCEVPDLDLLPKYYPIKKLRFSAGMESKTLHLLIWLLSWLIRLKIPLNLSTKAAFLLKFSRLFNFLGTDDGGMHVHMQGLDHDKKNLEKTWYIIAKNGDGPMIPTIPAVIMAKKILNGKIKASGVHPCIGMLTLQEYLQQLEDYEINVID